ncbi:type IV-A pilus assembly ATPase PilB [bacterium]|nr:type IV-A pilus assembly ATPase PilB [bacterium]
MSAGRLGDLLVARGLITANQLKDAVELRKQNQTRLSAALIQLGHVNENVLVTFLSQQYGIPAVSLDEMEVDEEVTKLVPVNLCEKHCLVPIEVEGNHLNIAISDPTNVAAVDDLRFLCNMEVNVFLATESAIKGLTQRMYQSAAEGPSDAPISIDDFNNDEDEKTGLIEVNSGDKKDAHEVDQTLSDKPVIRLINKLFVEAIRRKASDIHVEPYENYLRVRFRVNGSLLEVMRLPAQMKAATPARIKVMAQLDISEKRLPQDGRLQVKTKDKKIDIRVSVLPTIFGEKVVMRILDQGNVAPDIKGIGFEEEQARAFIKACQQPYGMLLVTGPTGSGKSTTLYAALSAVNGQDVNISTVEDPVEYNMGGVNQTQARENIGLTFATALRSLLRQDPDIVMVGEIRDTETAEIAIKASLTGHMVFSTLHTNDAPSTISRLVHMGIEPFLITASVILVQAQRLIRVNCEKCKEPDPRPTRENLIEAEVPEHWLETLQPMRGKGCEKCGGTGFTGRRGIFEVMPMSERLRTLIIKGANADDLKKAAIEDGMLTLRQHALIKFYRGETTLEEVLNNSRPDGDL